MPALRAVNAAQAPTPQTRVLLLYSVGYGRPIFDLYIRGMVATLVGGGISAENIFVEHLDLVRNPGPAFREAKVALLRAQYAHRPPQLVITVQQPALTFLAQQLPWIAPGVPVIAFGGDARTAGMPAGAPVLEVTVNPDVQNSLLLGTQLMPELNHVVLMLGTGEADRLLKTGVEQVAQYWQGRLSFEFLDTLTVDQMLERVAALPARTLLITGSVNRDVSGRSYIPIEVSDRVVRVANAPVFSFYDQVVMRGGRLGGYVSVVDDEARLVGELGLAVLGGDTTVKLPSTTQLPARAMVDWSALDRWGIDPARIPVDAIVLRRPQTLWSQYRDAVIGASAALGALSLLSVGLLLQNRQRRRAEARALDSEARQRALVESAPEAIVVVDQDLRIQQANPNAVILFGRPREALAGEDLAGLVRGAAAAAHDDEDAQLRTQARNAAAGTPAVFEREVVALDGTQRLCEVRLVALPGAAQALLRASFIDITERKRAEAEIKALNATLEQRVEDRTARLSAANEALRQARDAAEAATRAKSEFLANMSHEIRTPITAVLGMTDLALHTELTPRQRGYLARSRAATIFLLGALNDILDFSKIEAGKLELERSEFRLAEVVEQVASVIGQRAREKGLDLLVDIGPDVPAALVGDPLRLAQVLINLCGNAVKFTPAGEIVLSVRLHRPTPLRSLVSFSVRDSGIGLTAEEIRRLFQPFQQVDASTTRRYGGTGLGLAICRRLVALMGGEIGVNSQPGEGSDFHFTVPFGAAAELPAPPTLPALLQGLHVLVVDASATAREIAGALLRQIGARPVLSTPAPDAVAAAVDAAHGDPFGALLCDRLAWPADGSGWYGLLPARREVSPPRVLLLTAFGDDETGPEPARDGVGGRLGKPVMAQALVGALMRLCLPDFAPPPPSSDSGDFVVPPNLAGRRVLVVDDNELNQCIATELLRDIAGMQVAAASDGAEAIAAIAARPFDIVLMDMHMPVMDGLEATRRLRNDPACASLPVIAITANVADAELQRCLDAGMSDHVTKPFNAERLFGTLSHWLPATRRALP